MCIRDSVWIDGNADGKQNEAATQGVNGVKVTLLDAGGNAIGSTTTANDASNNPGYYAFTGLKPGTYSVQFDQTTLPAGYQFTTCLLYTSRCV